jgi:hypothetical protein
MPSIMNQQLLDNLTHASSFDLYQLMMAIQRILDDPARAIEIHQRLHVGMQVQYFDNRTVAPCRVTELRKNKVAVQDLNTNQYWLLPYTAILIDGSAAPAAKPPPPPAVDRSSFQVGDTVGFTDKYLNQRVGKVTRCNEKTATVDCAGSSWRVSWHLLNKIIDV